MYDFILNAFSRIDMSSKSITGVGINDILDILIISFLIYKVMLWIKETRAWSLLKGFLVILSIYAASYLFNLYTVRWLIGNTFSVGLIALVVIFQPELRRVLEQLGEGKYIFSLNIGTQNGALSPKAKEEIILAVTSMAKVRTGALIVVEREVGMSEYERTGIRLDSDISSQLLINIFEDKTPLHDGAVLIRRNRIKAATCILPLTQGDVDKDLGTRHRAAIGCSEVTDAIIIVVSEETGDISVARGGKIDRALSEDQLRSMLTVDNAEKKKRLTLWKGRQNDA